jgi:glycerophosphoryl diester phosphodiesterase
MASFRAAVELGCHWVECDCRPSLDGVVMLSHDPHVTDVSGRVYQVCEHPAAKLAALDLGRGEGVPTLAELVEFAVGRCGIMADVKCDGFEREIGDALNPLPAADKLAPGAGPLGRRRFRELYPSLPISLSVGTNEEALLLAEWDALDTDAVTLQHPLVTPQRIETLHERGIRVFAWTVDDLPTLIRLRDMGVDGLISNRADLLARL